MIDLIHVTKAYQSGNMSVLALDDISLSLPESGMVFITGKSGSGKSTLLNLLGGLDIPTSGEIKYAGTTIGEKDFDLDEFRNRTAGFIFQDINLDKSMTIAENVGMPLRLQNLKPDAAVISSALERAGLLGKEKKRPNQLSGGEQQRAAIARAIVKNPHIILADEPTGNLDFFSGKQVFELLKEISKERLVVVVSHDAESTNTYADRIIELSDGAILSDREKADFFKTASASFENGKLLLAKGERLSVAEIELIGKNFKADNVEISTEAAFKDVNLSDEAHDLGKNAVLESTDNDVKSETEIESESEDEETKTERISADAEAKTASKPKGKKGLHIVNVLFFALKNLLSHPLKTISTVLICAILLGLAGLAVVITTNDLSVSSARTYIENIEEEHIIFYKYVYKTPTELMGAAPLLDSEIAEASKKFPNSATVMKSLNSVNISVSEMDYSATYMYEIGGVFELSDAAELDTFGWKLMNFTGIFGAKSDYYSRFPSTGRPVSDGAGGFVNEVVITDFLAMLIYREHYGIPVSNTEAFLKSGYEYKLLEDNTKGEKHKGVAGVFPFGANEFKIVGILDTGFKDKYLDEFDAGRGLEGMRQNKLFVMAEGLYCVFYTGEGFAETCYGDMQSSVNHSFVLENTAVHDFYKANDLIEYASWYDQSVGLKAGEVLITENMFRYYFAKDFTADGEYYMHHDYTGWGEDESWFTMDKTKNLFEYARFDADTLVFKVAGVIQNGYGINQFKRDYGAILCAADYEKAGYDLAYNKGLYFSINQKNAYDIFAFATPKNLRGASEYAYGAEAGEYTLNSMKTLFMPILIVMLVVSVLGIALFIVTAVTKKQHEIGMLKSMGAKTSDIIGIYLTESMFVLLLIAALGTLITTGLFFICDNLLRSGLTRTGSEEFFKTLTILYLSWRPYLTIVLTTFAVGIISAIYPTVMIVKMQPINAIKKLS